MGFYWHLLLVLCLFQMATLLTQSASVPAGFQQAAAGQSVNCVIEGNSQHPSQENRRRDKRLNIAAHPNIVDLFLPLKTRKSIRSKEVTLRRVHSHFRRQQYRTLTFRYRIYRITRNRRILVSRINKLRIQYKTQKQLMLWSVAKFRSLTQQFNLLPKNARISHTVRHRLKLEIKQISAKIEALKRETASLKQRIERASARQRRMGHRIELLQQRLQRQIRVGIRAVLEIGQILARSNIFTSKANSRVTKAANQAAHTTSNDAVDSTKTGSIYVPKSKAAVLKIMSTVKVFHAKLLHEYVKVLESQEGIKKYKNNIQGLEDRLKKLSQQVHLTEEADLQILKQTILQIKRKLAQLRSMDRDEEKKLAQNKKMVKLSLVNSVLYLNKYGLNYTEASRMNVQSVAKDQRRILRRAQRRKKLQAKYKVIIRQVSSAGNISPSTAHKLVKQNASRIYRTERKRIAKRVVKRVKRIEKKINHGIHKAEIVRQRKLHIQKRQRRLERRAQRIISRDAHIKQTIANEEIKYTLLVKQLNLLKLNKAKLRSLGKSVGIAQRADAQIEEASKKVTDHLKSINKLKVQHVRILSRLRNINLKKQRLAERLAAIQQRSERNNKKIQRLVTTERKFVRRVVKKKLVTPSVIQRLVTPGQQIILDQKVALLKFQNKPIKTDGHHERIIPAHIRRLVKVGIKNISQHQSQEYRARGKPQTIAAHLKTIANVLRPLKTRKSISTVPTSSTMETSRLLLSKPISRRLLRRVVTKGPRVVVDQQSQLSIDQESPGKAEDSSNGGVVESYETQVVNEPVEEVEIVHE